MTELKKKRYELIKENMTKRSGIYRNNEIICGVWELASDLNNTWNSKPFLSKKNQEELREPQRFKGSFSIADYNIPKMFNGIKHGVKGTNIKYIEQGHGLTDYLVMKL